jgi:tetratricopeptide (TPR) repeat protein
VSAYAKSKLSSVDYVLDCLNESIKCFGKALELDPSPNFAKRISYAIIYNYEIIPQIGLKSGNKTIENKAIDIRNYMVYGKKIFDKLLDAMVYDENIFNKPIEANSLIVGVWRKKAEILSDRGNYTPPILVSIMVPSATVHLVMGNYVLSASYGCDTKPPENYSKYTNMTLGYEWEVEGPTTIYKYKSEWKNNVLQVSRIPITEYDAWVARSKASKRSNPLIEILFDQFENGSYTTQVVSSIDNKEQRMMEATLHIEKKGILPSPKKGYTHNLPYYWTSPMTSEDQNRWLAAESNEDKSEDWFWEAIALGNEHKFNESVKAYYEAIRLNPYDWKPWYNNGLALNYTGKYSEANDAFNVVIILYPTNQYAWTNKGIALYYLGKYDEAIQAYNKALQLTPGFTDALDGKRLALKALGGTAERD